jgi:hypothetical protein
VQEKSWKMKNKWTNVAEMRVFHTACEEHKHAQNPSLYYHHMYMGWHPCCGSALQWLRFLLHLPRRRPLPLYLEV